MTSEGSKRRDFLSLVFITKSISSLTKLIRKKSIYRPFTVGFTHLWLQLIPSSDGFTQSNWSRQRLLAKTEEDQQFISIMLFGSVLSSFWAKTPKG